MEALYTGFQQENLFATIEIMTKETANAISTLSIPMTFEISEYIQRYQDIAGPVIVTLLLAASLAYTAYLLHQSIANKRD